MTDIASSLVHSHYGHLGRPQYNADKNEWTFSKSLEETFGFRALGPAEVVFASDQDPSAVHLDVPVQRKTLKYLTITLPEVGHVKDVLNLEAESIASAVLGNLGYDPMVGDLLVAAPSRPLLAFPAAEPGIAVKVAKLGAIERMMTCSDSELAIPVDASKVSELQQWQGLPVRPLQLALSCQESNGPEFLAIRYSNHMSILSTQPFSSRNPKAPMIQRLKHILEFTMGQRHDDTIADVFFNPVHSQRFAIVTRSGKWAVYDIKRAAMKSHAKRLAGGDIMQEDADSDIPIKRDDGWKRIRWFINQSYVVIATRKKLWIQNLTNQLFHEMHLDTINDKRSWILDIKTTQWPNHPKMLFVLTTRKIFVIQASAPLTDRKSMVNQTHIQATIKISVIHERDPLDLTVKMKLIDEGKGLFSVSCKWYLLLMC
jgi:hypothetical protein